MNAEKLWDYMDRECDRAGHNVILAATRMWLKFCLAVFLANMTIEFAVALPEQAWAWRRFAEHWRWRTLPGAVLLLAALVAVISVLWRARLLRLSWWSLFTLIDGKPHKHEGANIILLPMMIPWLCLPYAILFGAQLPGLAYAEEAACRFGIDGWQAAVWGSLSFGLAHCVVGVPIAAGLAISLAGGAFTLAYWHGGLGASSTLHATMNLLVVAIAAALVTAIQKRAAAASRGPAAPGPEAAGAGGASS